MGILDDAIREHLELKRQHGAAQSDIERLEQEAFGAAVRPGDPGYETGESPIPPLEEASEADEAPTTVAPSPAAEERTGETESEVDPIEAPEAAIFDVEGDELDVASMSTEDFAAAAGSSEPTPAERARQEHPHLDDTIDHPGPAPKSLSEELEEAAPEVDEGEPAQPEPDLPASEGSPAPSEPLLDPESDEHLAPEPIERPAAREDDPDEQDDEDDRAEDESDDADLLEETPEFLKDAPEGEDLWFEQGPPKDFDFD